MCLRQGEVGGAAVPGKQNVDMDAKRPSHAFRAHAVTTWKACREARGPSTAQLRLRASTPPYAPCTPLLFTVAKSSGSRGVPSVRHTCSHLGG